MINPHEDIGYPPRSTQRQTPNAKRHSPHPHRPSPSAPRPSPSIDPDILDAPSENDFTRWYAEQCREKNRPSKLRRNA